MKRTRVCPRLFTTSQTHTHRCVFVCVFAGVLLDAAPLKCSPFTPDRPLAGVCWGDRTKTDDAARHLDQADGPGFKGQRCRGPTPEPSESADAHVSGHVTRGVHALTGALGIGSASGGVASPYHSAVVSSSGRGRWGGNTVALRRSLVNISVRPDAYRGSHPGRPPRSAAASAPRLVLTQMAAYTTPQTSGGRAASEREGPGFGGACCHLPN